MRSIALCACVALALPSFASAQSNAVTGMDFRAGDYGPLTLVGRLGAFPNGIVAVSGSSTVCNAGTESIAWTAPMSEDHPLFAFLVVREDADRLVQISDRSYVKHPFAAINSTACSPCSSSGFGLRPGCSDTYGAFTNSSRFWLGPPEEINPWLGEWTAFGSLFDGIPVDGDRDYNGDEPNEINHRIQVRDADLSVNGRYFYAMNLLQEGEAADVRENNMGYREFTRAHNGGNWSFNDVGGGLLTLGTVLNVWTGATVVTADNIPNDGHVHIAYKVVDNGNGGFRYEYALHNQDNNRQIGKVTIPRSSASVITNLSFRDIDQDASNDWTITVTPQAIEFETNDNPIAWNTIYNFGFDADVAGTPGSMELDQFFAGPGSDTIGQIVMTPGGEPSERFCFGGGGVTPGCTDCPCANNFLNANGGCTNGSGSSAELDRSGSPSVANDTLRLDFTSGNPSTFVLLASADNALPQMGACPPGSGIATALLDGLRCVGGNLIRHGVRATDSSGDAVAGWGPPDGPAGGLAAQGGFAAGQTRHFQAFYREDPTLVCLTGQNTSNAVSATFEL